MVDIDRAKVIKGLEDAYRVIEDYVPSRNRGYSRLACCDAIDLLREQEPAKPKEIIFDFGDGSDPYLFGWECGSCGGWLPFSSNNYCPKCGKKVKWDG